MPELPEVHTTVQGLNRVMKGKKIVAVWSSYNSSFHRGKDNIKNVHYFKNFERAIVGAKFVRATRRGKNILIHLSTAHSAGHTVLIHMKMTGHLMYGAYDFDRKKNVWSAHDASTKNPLTHPKNQFIRLVFSLSDGKQVAFSDMRKFAKVFVFPTNELERLPDLADLGPEPLESQFTLRIFKERLKLRPNWKIKQTLMDQSIIAGIGNIYSDEILWKTGVHPASVTGKIPNPVLARMFTATKYILKRGIHFGGDSESDYRNIDGEPGEFQNKHQAYRHTGEVCSRPGCRARGGVIVRAKIGGRSAHYCSFHQILYK